LVSGSTGIPGTIDTWAWQGQLYYKVTLFAKPTWPFQQDRAHCSTAPLAGGQGSFLVGQVQYVIEKVELNNDPNTTIFADENALDKENEEIAAEISKYIK